MKNQVEGLHAPLQATGGYINDAVQSSMIADVFVSRMLCKASIAAFDLTNVHITAEIKEAKPDTEQRHQLVLQKSLVSQSRKLGPSMPVAKQSIACCDGLESRNGEHQAPDSRAMQTVDVKALTPQLEDMSK